MIKNNNREKWFHTYSPVDPSDFRKVSASIWTSFSDIFCYIISFSISYFLYLFFILFYLSASVPVSLSYIYIYIYKVRIIGTVEQSLRLGVVVIEKGAFMLPSTKIANFTYIYIYIYIYI